VRASGSGRPGGATALERGETLAFVATLGSPLPLAELPNGGGDKGWPAAVLQVPSQRVLRRWPHLRGGWSNFHHRADSLAYALQPSQSACADYELRRRHKGDTLPVQSAYVRDLVDCVRPIAQSLSWVWQDTNRTTTS
jgi:hypothetical protein